MLLISCCGRGIKIQSRLTSQIIFKRYFTLLIRFHLIESRFSKLDSTAGWNKNIKDQFETN